MNSRILCGAAFACATLVSSIANAVTGCPSTPIDCQTGTDIVNPVYILAADTQVPVLHKLGKRLRADANPITIVYVPNGSCTNLPNLYSSAAFVGSASGGGPYYIPSDTSFDVTQKTACACTPPTSGSITPDMAISIVVPDAVSCPGLAAKPPTVTLTRGAVQGMTFVVPSISTQKAITAEEAYLVLGLGAGNAAVSPWSDSNFIYGRTATKGTQVSIGLNIGVPAAKWKLLDAAHKYDQSSDLAAKVASFASDVVNGEKVLGILGVEIYDKAANRASMHALAYRAYKQLKAYWPDKSINSFDKQNIRDGHYTLWSYVFFAATDGTTAGKAPTRVQEIIDALSNSPITVSPTFDPIDDVISSGLVPQCAMKVQRSSEGGDLSLYSDPAPCACYYEFKQTAATSCASCASTPCATGVCRRGYCEAN